MSYDLALWCDLEPAGRDAQVVHEPLVDGPVTVS
jgi:hypothetical protein